MAHPRWAWPCAATSDSRPGRSTRTTPEKPVASATRSIASASSSTPGRYRSTGASARGDGGYDLTGELTIVGTTRTVQLDLTYSGTVTVPWGNSRIVFSAETEIDRDEFGLTWNQALESGGVLVGRTVKIEIEVEAVRAAA
ncbi:MAG: YceI family protein [Actinomycetota bacterium]|nr:YceI family protein [Actinomycetota bacterium]